MNSDLKTRTTTCYECHGVGIVQTHFGIALGVTVPLDRECPTCLGSGIVERPLYLCGDISSNWGATRPCMMPAGHSGVHRWMSGKQWSWWSDRRRQPRRRIRHGWRLWRYRGES